MAKPSTLGALRASGYQTRSVKDEIRRNLMRKLKPVLKAHEARMVGKIGDEGRDRLIDLLREIAGKREANGAELKVAKASRSPRPGSAET